MTKKEVSDSEIVKPLKKIVRIATKKDIEHSEENRRREKSAFEICQE
jgi:cell fate regulator YaaT (PSP1 superfamily)